jgi:predicted delta-1-pyrroline-5-carboxylate dehydrogenase group 2
MAALPGAPSHALGEFRNEPLADFSRENVRKDFHRALAHARGQFPFEAPLVIGGQRRSTPERIESHSPSDLSVLVGTSASATLQDTDRAISAARSAFPGWSRAEPGARAAVLVRAAELMRRSRMLLAAVMVYEAAKPWREADADVCEAIDFLEYYAREAMRLARRRRLQPYVLGERNELRYDPLGVVGVIGPWNFPLAIPVGMASAAIVAGNTVVLKPAEQTPIIAHLFAEIMEQAGLPAGVLNYLPGRGEVCGARLVAHPDVNMIAFTGSRDVGLMIIREAAKTPPGQHFVKRVVAEMGGKNAIIIDSTADIDSAIPDVLYSAFGFSGQKCSACSRLIVLQDLKAAVIERLAEGVTSLKIGPADHPGTQVNAVIDREAQLRIAGFIDDGRRDARTIVLHDTRGLERTGCYVPPAVFEVDSAKHVLAQEEIFGPVLTLLTAKSFDNALEIANSTAYALTGGVHSRTLSHLEAPSASSTPATSTSTAPPPAPSSGASPSAATASAASAPRPAARTTSSSSSSPAASPRTSCATASCR